MIVYLLSVTFPVFKKWRLDPFILKNLCFMSILHLFSIKTAEEPYLSNHNLDIRIYYVVVEITDYSFFKVELILIKVFLFKMT
jgi:hypothetical protein